ncbi:MAG: hypothetical protein J0G29_05100 [Alphaproteobacteria bacterium]|nr:hypothetical protein [Alphaproteobacteria bacterium]OJV44969.1 MAG: hypothetical protein BGO28_05375 [Alphaproteobacteria bacterium 43-37]
MTDGERGGEEDSHHDGELKFSDNSVVKIQITRALTENDDSKALKTQASKENKTPNAILREELLEREGFAPGLKQKINAAGKKGNRRFGNNIPQVQCLVDVPLSEALNKAFQKKNKEKIDRQNKNSSENIGDYLLIALPFDSYPKEFLHSMCTQFWVANQSLCAFSRVIIINEDFYELRLPNEKILEAFKKAAAQTGFFCSNDNPKENPSQYIWDSAGKFEKILLLIAKGLNEYCWAP